MVPSTTGARLRGPLLAVGLVLLVVLTALLVDARVADWAEQGKSPVLDALVAALNPIGSGVVLLVICLALAGLSHVRRRSSLRAAASCGAVAFAAAGLVEFTLKHLVGRPRPDAEMPALVLLGPSFVPDVDSFPSGHATSAFSVATVFAAFYPRASRLFYALAAAIAAGRVYLERHYVSDVLAGALLGIVVASCLLRRRGPQHAEG
jgi:undecaprenyl-diphosphatase